MKVDIDPSFKYRAKIATANGVGRRAFIAEEMEPGKRPPLEGLPLRTVFRLEVTEKCRDELDRRVGRGILEQAQQHGIEVITSGKGLYRWHITLGGGGLLDGDLGQLYQLTQNLNRSLSDELTEMLEGVRVPMDRLVIDRTMTLRATNPGAEIEEARLRIDSKVREFGMNPDYYGDIFHASGATVIDTGTKEQRAGFIDGLTRGAVTNVARNPVSLSFVGPVVAMTLEYYALYDRKSLVSV